MDRRVRKKRVGERRERCGRRRVLVEARRVRATCDRGGGRPFREDGAPILNENEQVRNAVEVNVDDGTYALLCDRNVLLDQVDAIVEVPIPLTLDERPVYVVFVFVWLAIEVPIDGNADELIAGVVNPPDIRPSVPILIARADEAVCRRKREAHVRRTRQRARDRGGTRERQLHATERTQLRATRHQ